MNPINHSRARLLAQFNTFPRSRCTAVTLGVGQLLMPLCVMFGASANAQNTINPEPVKQDKVTITGNPLGNDEVVAPVSVLQGEKLLLQREGTIAATLDKEPGVSSTRFGPNADRPVIRGLDADRIRILGNGGASVDASSLSFDHAVPIDPLAVQRIEVLRGPAALLYGGSAVGGVVNIIDNRVPRDPIDAPTGALEWRTSSATRGGNGSALIEGGNGTVALHADAFARKADNTRIPGLQLTPARRAQAQAHLDAGNQASLGGEGEILNSQSRASGGALGASLTRRDGYIGLAVNTYRSLYGTVAEPAVQIDMQQDQLRLEGQARKIEAQTAGLLSTLNIKAVRSRYEHTELDNGTPATTFKSHGNEWRIDAQHAPVQWGSYKLSGVVGAQQEMQQFSALGDEAFVPNTHTRISSLFVFEELGVGKAKFSLGARMERSRVRSEGALSGDAADRFGAASERTFSLLNLSASSLINVAEHWSMGLQATRNERAPTFYELYSDGVHAATGSYEQGDAALSKERSHSVELSLRYKSAALSGQLSMYQTRFSNYIGLFDSGERLTNPQQSFPIFRFAALPAKFMGVEWEAKVRLVQTPYTWDVNTKLDVVRATDLSNNAPLPRVAPLRMGLGTDVSLGAFSANASLEWNAKPQVPQGEYQSDAYTLLNMSAAYRLPLSEALNAQAFVKLTNLTNATARPAASLLREVSPLAGRAIEMGVQLKF